MDDEKDLDLAVFGATGFTGRRVVRHLAGNAPADLRWAVAGRDRTALERLGAGVPVLVADVTDPAALSEVLARTRVVLNMAGPFRRLGDPVVAACIERSTHYCDISGETARVRDLVDRHQDAARRAGVKVVCFAGASSAPADLAVLLLEEELGEPPREVAAVVRLRSGLFNGGTLSSMRETVESGDADRERDPFLLGPRGRQPTSREQDPVGVRYDRALRVWLVRSPLGISDTWAIRSSALRGGDVVVQEHLAFDGVRGVVPAVAVRGTLGAIATVLRTRPGRAVLSRIAPPGTGPSDRQVDGGSYRLDVTGTSADGRRARVTMGFYGDPGNHVTALCAAETALALAAGGPGQPDRAGVLTPSTAVGADLAPGLLRAGMRLTRTRIAEGTQPGA